ncbi:MFS transporter [Mycobacterium antarcticum]|uniref:MFS transporter n=1 Tax=unclassified Mycolicibacterium TaxID=2636767 RepID=UPI0023A4A56D|nr:MULTISPECIES: MFS transporter [unclassified Mycolicibacterium]BDX30853.1 MFS transporter [Mycolicibacterium sp. TUM20985]GLP74217.1 MFS transporter [Mycolicibacterium sp. TUM20983]GLP80013.1 MFS transporter [Mycolicibacterium sp. TUM20984]
MTAARQLLRTRTGNPWYALWALLVGFFMILLDATIVAVANPSIMDALDVDYDAVIWVTSAYLLAYAVPLLLAGRLGDRFGPRNLYLAGLAVFTGASLWCGLAGSIETLVAARAVQGLGAALLTPQTLSTITRIFPAERRGVALSVWGATAGVATLVGPLAGGVLVDGLGWQWIFIVNVPIGIAGLVLAYIFVPVLPTEKHGFDVLGVVLSGAGMLMIVFALQEGQSHDWAPWVWGMLAAGVAAIAGFVYWQAVNPAEPLIPLKIFRDNDFSLSNVGIAVIGFAVTAMIVPVMFYAQAVCGLSPTRAALLTAPMAVATGVLAPFVGRLVDRSHPRPIVGFGFSALAIALTWLSFEMTPTTPIWRLLLPFLLMGIGMAFIWSPLAATATRNLPPQLAGAGSGVYNTTRQVGSVLGSAAMAALMTAQISAALPPELNPGVGQGAVTRLPGFLHEPFSEALSRSLLLPAFVALFGVIAALFLRGFGGGGPAGGWDSAPPRRHADPAEPDYFRDDDEYVEYEVDWSASADEDAEWDRPTPAPDVVTVDESVTSPFAAHVEHPLPAPADTWHGGPVEEWHSLMEDEADTVPELIAIIEPDRPVEPIPPRNGHAPWRGMLEEPLDGTTPNGSVHNGFHVESEAVPQVSASGGRHSRDERHGDDDAGTYGRHSMRFRT